MDLTSNSSSSNSVLSKPLEIGESIGDSVQSSFSNIKDGVSNTLKPFQTGSIIGTDNTSFINSNGIIAKFVFFIFIVAIFLFLAKVGVYLISRFLQPPNSPYVISGLINGNSNVVVSQNPNDPGAVPIKRSNNRDKGIEATWSVWLNIDSLQPTTSANGDYSHIFSKGNNAFGSNGIATVNNAPGVYLKKGTDNTIRIVMDTVSGNASNYIDVTNIPLRKWFHLAVRIQNNLVDVYVNGTMAGRKTFENTLKQNYDDVLVGHNGGFNGNLSNLLYSDHALTIFDLNNLLLKGPSLTQSGTVRNNLGFYSYLSNMWYYNKM
jgi:hypothetical protein